MPPRCESSTRPPPLVRGLSIRRQPPCRASNRVPGCLSLVGFAGRDQRQPSDAARCTFPCAACQPRRAPASMGGMTKSHHRFPWDRVGRASSHGASRGALSGAVGATRHMMNAASGRISGRDAAAATVGEVAKGALRGGLTSGGGAAIAAASTRAGLRTFARSSGPLAVAGFAVDAGGSLLSFATGEVDGSRCARDIAKSATTGVGALAGAEAGALLGTAICPIAGTAVGAALGGILGSLGISALWD